MSNPVFNRFSAAFLANAFTSAIASRLAPPRKVVPVERVSRTVGIFNAGRNAEKRAARKASKELRARLVAKADGKRVPKIEHSRLMIDMLANRRLRQRGAAA